MGVFRVDNKFYYKEKGTLCAKKRIDGTVMDFFNCIYIFDKSEDDEIVFDYLKLMDKLSIDDNDIIDFFYYDEGRIGDMAIIEDFQQTEYQRVLDFVNVKIYKTGINTLAAIFRNALHITAKSIRYDISEDSLEIDISSQTPLDKLPQIQSVDFDRYHSTGYIKNQNKIENFQAIKYENFVALKIYGIEDVFKSFARDGGLDFVVRINFGFPNINGVINFSNPTISNTGKKFELNLEKGKRGELIICVHHIATLGVFGSCYSRRMFTDTHYFNPGYRDKYNILFTQFHSTVESVICEDRTEYDENIFRSFHPVIQKYIKSDFQKTFFEELKQHKPDYLLIDLYADFQRSTVVFDNGRKISWNAYIEQIKYLDTLDEKYVLNNPFNSVEYLEEWKIYADQFILKMLDVMPESKIIINKIKPATIYRSKEGQIKNFHQGKNIQRANSLSIFLDYMQDYFIRKLPKAKILDSGHLSEIYIGDESNPDGLLVHHFESNYYKEQMNKLSQICFK